MVVARDPAPDLPADAAVDLDLEDEITRLAVILERGGEVWREGDVGAGEHRGPDADVAVALVDGRQRGGDGDLLVLVGGVDVEAVVVDPDPVVGVARGDGDLEHGREEGGGRGCRRGVCGKVELAERGVLEEEARVGRAEDEVDDERDDGDDEGEGEEEGEEAPAPVPQVVVAVVAAVLAHGRPLKDDEAAGGFS